MRSFRFHYASLATNQASFHQSFVQKQSFVSVHGPFPWLYQRMASGNKMPILVRQTDSSHQRLSIFIRGKGLRSTQIPLDANNDFYGAYELDESHNLQKPDEGIQEKNFWGAVGLILGTAVGPGMLGLPAAFLKSGPVPSTITLILSWLYVISSIILVAELSFAVMEEDGDSEVSFTGLARKTLGNRLGSFVALVYASLSFSLLVACVSGIGAIVSQLFPWLNPAIANAVFPFTIGIMLWLFPFSAIDAANRLLCILMLLSITALVAIGILVGRTSILNSFSYASWEISSVLPAVPIAVLTLGFHVITPFICKIAGNTVQEAYKAILIGGFVPLLMVLSWNLIVLGLSGSTAVTKDPISLLLSVNPSALAAVQGFAFSALATSLVGYAVSFPKQFIDTLELIFSHLNLSQHNFRQSQAVSVKNGVGKVGIITFTYEDNTGSAGKISYDRLNNHHTSEFNLVPVLNILRSSVMPLVLSLPVIIACLFPSTFSRALDFAGIYANCFLFGILPPAMVHIYQRKTNHRYINDFCFYCLSRILILIYGIVQTDE